MPRFCESYAHNPYVKWTVWLTYIKEILFVAIRHDLISFFVMTDIKKASISPFHILPFNLVIVKHVIVFLINNKDIKI